MTGYRKTPRLNCNNAFWGVGSYLKKKNFVLCVSIFFIHITNELYLYCYSQTSIRQIGNATPLGERRPDRFCYANEHISVHCPSFGSLPICPDRLRLPSWLTIPAETGLGQLSQGSRYGSHHAPFHVFLETSWRIGNETLSTL